MTAARGCCRWPLARCTLPTDYAWTVDTLRDSCCCCYATAANASSYTGNILWTSIWCHVAGSRIQQVLLINSLTAGWLSKQECSHSPTASQTVVGCKKFGCNRNLGTVLACKQLTCLCAIIRALHISEHEHTLLYPVLILVASCPNTCCTLPAYHVCCIHNLSYT
jgi:hypothetical protein